MAQKDIFPVTGLAAAGQILPFYLAGENGDGALIRGRLASVGGPASSILARHGYPEMVASLQAEALAIAACLSTFMKFDGVFTLQAKGNGFVKTLLADVTSDGALRGYAAFDDEIVPSLGDDMVAAMPASVPALLGTGYAAFTVDQGTENGRYQGIVELAGETLAMRRWPGLPIPSRSTATSLPPPDGMATSGSPPR